MWGSHIHTRDLNVTLDVSYDQVFNVHPQFHGKMDLSGDVKYGFFIFGWLLRWILPPELIMRTIELAVTTLFEELNKVLADPSDQFGLIGLSESLLLNLSPAKPVDADPVTDLIEFSLDGRIFNGATGKYETKNCELEAVRFDRSHSNQIFIHQSMLEDIAQGASRKFFPMEVKTQGFNELLGIYIP